MMLIFGLMLLQTAACVEFTCRFGQSDPCYAALGLKLNLTMLDARYHRLKIIKRINNNQDDPFCKVKNDTKSKTECDLYNNRPEVTFINGTLIINRVIREDSRNYTLEIERSGGSVSSSDLQVKVEAPIGSVEVSLTCSSSGGKSVSCSSDGDLLIYSWTLNGDPLTDANTNIHLNETTEGVIICSVKNHVSDGRKGISVEHCPGTTTVVMASRMTSTLTSSTQTPEHVCSEPVEFVLVWCFQMMALFGLLGGFHIYMRHTSERKQDDHKLRMRRFREDHEHTAEDSRVQQQISAHL